MWQGCRIPSPQNEDNNGDTWVGKRAAPSYQREENQARKKSTKINFLGPETAWWGGGLPREGVGVEKFVPSLESLSSWGFEERNLGRPGDFAGMSTDPWGGGA